LQLDDTYMTWREDLNFLITNRIPRRWLTLWFGWFSRIETPWIYAASMALWRMISPLDLSDAKKAQFTSVHDCFTRELRDGARPIDKDPNVVASPCDAIIGASGTVEDGMVLQAKGFPYALTDLLPDPALVEAYRIGTYVTLRLASYMYHRFHAPYDCQVRRVTYVSGDTWNVNPIALKRIERLFCRNERAVIECALSPEGPLITLVPVAAILVASIQLKFLNVRLHLKYPGPNVIECNATLKKGEEMGWFEHGSTILIFAPPGFALCSKWRSGDFVRAGHGLIQFCAPHSPS
jgi:phosphatidylserine decarboxylase